MPLQVAVLAEMNNMLDIALPVVVSRMCFSREDELNRPGSVPRELHDIFELLENERRALVSRKTPGEPNGQRVRVQQLVESDEIALRQALPLNQQSPSGKLDEFTPKLVSQ